MHSVEILDFSAVLIFLSESSFGNEKIFVKRVRKFKEILILLHLREINCANLITSKLLPVARNLPKYCPTVSC